MHIFTLRVKRILSRPRHEPRREPAAREIRLLLRRPRLLRLQPTAAIRFALRADDLVVTIFGPRSLEFISTHHAAELRHRQSSRDCQERRSALPFVERETRLRSAEAPDLPLAPPPPPMNSETITTEIVEKSLAPVRPNARFYRS